MALCIANKLPQSQALFFCMEIPPVNFSEDTECPLLWLFSGFAQSLLINPAKSSFHIFPNHNRAAFRCNIRRPSDIPVRTHTLLSAVGGYKIMRISFSCRVYGDNIFHKTTGTHLLSCMASYPKWPNYSSPVWKKYSIHLNISKLHQQYVGRIAQSVSRLATAWRAGDRILVGARISTTSRLTVGPTQLPTEWVPSVSRG